MRATRILWILCILLLMMFAIPYPTQGQTPPPQSPPITLDLAEPFYEYFTTDPVLATDRTSFTAIENLYLGLLNLDPVTGDLTPELAHAWDISADGLTYIFHLRDDVWWVYWMDGQITQWRVVTAGDFVASIERGCLPNRDADGKNRYYGTIIAPLIAGCDVLNALADDAPIPPDTVQVAAPDDFTLQITLATPAAYFLSMTALPILHPTPADTADLPEGVTPTNGPYLAQALSSNRRVFVRNPHLPPDLWYGGNIEVININDIQDGGTIYALFIDNQLDETPVPQAEIWGVTELPDIRKVVRIPDDAVFYFGFAHDKPPFDNVHVRRAFSAILDRQAFVEQIRAGRGVPMAHFTPPEMAYAPPREGIGIGFDPDYAREQLALAGYPDCKGFPNIDMVAYIGAGTWLEFWAEAAEEYLGCDPALFNTETLEFSVLLEVVGPESTLEDRPHAWTLGWGAEFPDAHNWVHDVLHCTDSYASEQLNRPCSSTDDLIMEAGTNPDPAERTRLYAEIEEAFFGQDGEMPIAPLFQRMTFVMVQDWYTGSFETDSVMGMRHWDAYSIDREAKLAAREG
ncbi:MAG: ABC transporter substrate-binding protein [Chloroflexota bacterium]|nr:MAG: ABC transporter substrate-binding protein [Chloroflexota bacterium]